MDPDTQQTQNPADPQQQGHPLFPHTIGDPNVDNSEPVAQPELSPAEQQLQQLQQRLEQREQEWNERERRYQEQFDMLLQQRTAPVAPAVAQAEPPAQLPSLEDLPDPIQNPSQFNQELARRIQAREQALIQSMHGMQQNTLSEMTKAAAIDSLWHRFRAQHADLAQREALLQGAAAVTFNELRARGLDPATIAMQNPDTIIGAIAQRMHAELGGAGAAGSATSGTPTGAARTVGIAGGSTNVAGANTNAQPPKIPSFVEQVRKQQQAMGII